MDVYVTIMCANCDEEIYSLVRTFDERNGIPVISGTIAEQSSFDCDECGHTTYTGEMEINDEDDL